MRTETTSNKQTKKVKKQIEKEAEEKLHIVPSFLFVFTTLLLLVRPHKVRALSISDVFSFIHVFRFLIITSRDQYASAVSCFKSSLLR